VRPDPAVPTNRNFVLRLGHERTILVHHEQHECHWPHLRPSEVPSWIFLSSVGRDAHAYEDQIADWLEASPDVSLAFEPGTLQIARGAPALARLYRRSGLVVCNREEAALLTGGSADEPPTVLLDRMLGLGPERVVITDGSRGAYGADGSCCLEVPVFPDDAPVVDRTGAGDAFAGALVAAVASGLPLDEAMARAPVNATRVVQEVGTQAGLLHRGVLESLLAGAPSGYGVHPVSR
jgi:sugar/nucleoside kinase (ribokinase family)